VSLGVITMHIDVLCAHIAHDESEDMPRSKKENSFTADGHRQGTLTMDSPCPSVPGPIPTPDPPLPPDPSPFPGPPLPEPVPTPKPPQPPDPSPFPGPPITICQFTHLLTYYPALFMTVLCKYPQSTFS
jgi:hypothetical protein